MLYDRLLLDLGRAETAQHAANWPVASENLLHAQAIITELAVPEDLTSWDGAEDLLGVYNYAFTALVNANIHRNVADPRRRQLLEPLRQAWHEAAANLPGQRAPGPPPAACSRRLTGARRRNRRPGAGLWRSRTVGTASPKGSASPQHSAGPAFTSRWTFTTLKPARRWLSLTCSRRGRTGRRPGPDGSAAAASARAAGPAGTRRPDPDAAATCARYRRSRCIAPAPWQPPRDAVAHLEEARHDWPGTLPPSSPCRKAGPPEDPCSSTSQAREVSGRLRTGPAECRAARVPKTSHNSLAPAANQPNARADRCKEHGSLTFQATDRPLSLHH